MSKKLYCFMWTLRRMQACLHSGSPVSRAASRTFASGINGPPQSVPWKKRQSLASPSWQQPCHRYFSQDVQIAKTENANSNDEKNANDVLEEHVQGPGPLTVRNSQPPDYLASPQQGNSEIEGIERENIPQQFFNDLQLCNSSSDVLDLISKYPVSKKYISTYFSRMWTLTKKLSVRQRGYERSLMLEHPNFSKLCQALVQEAKFMWREDLVYSMLAVVNLGIPQDTLLVQTLLRVCQERLNEFNNRCLSILASTLQEMEKSKNVEALQFGLQLLVEKQLSKTSDVFMLQTYMKCIGKNAPLTLKIKLENKIFEKMHDFTVPNAQHMFHVLAKMNYCSLPILNACSDKVTEHIQGTPFKQLLNILLSCHDLRYRNNRLYSAMGDYVASVVYMFDVKQIVQLLSAFKNLNCRPVELMDMVAEQVMSEPESFNLKNILYVLQCYSYLNHFPKDQKERFLESLNAALNNFLPRISNIELLRAVHAFCTAGYIPQPAVDQLLQDEIVHSLISDERITEAQKKMLRTINVCLQLDGNSSAKQADSWIEEEPIQHVIDIPVVENMLGTLLGDPRLYQPNVKVSHGYQIDFQILMDADRKILLPNTESDQLTADSNIKRIALLCPPGSYFCRGSSHPKGILAMKMRHLRLLGYQVILIPYPEIQQRTFEEAVELLKRKLFQAEGCLIPE